MTKEDNKRIAEFMGLEIIESKHKYITTYYVILDDMPTDLHDLEYHTSFYWLRPVIHKIEKYLWDNQGKIRYFDEGLQSNDIDVRYQSVGEFIKFFNQNK